MASRLIVKRNDFGKVVEALHHELKSLVDDMGDDMVDLYKGTVWKRTGVLASTIESRDLGPYKVEVTVGWYLGRGFYSGFPEFGTIHQDARPVVRPGAMAAEPVYAQFAREALKRAADAGA
jgi:HK97 gp10 family phage protein